MPDLGVNKFDKAAIDYDCQFTNSHIGKAQRNRVYHFLKDHIQNGNKLNILELNCGTGEDALFFARKGHSVLATDISDGMLEVARSKDVSKAVHFKKMDLKHLELLKPEAPFDLIFSNFGGINCINEPSLRKLFSELSPILAENGSIVAVIMPPFCLWESIFFSLKLKFMRVLRRRKMAVVNVSGTNVETYYYSPLRISKLLPPNLKITKLKPIGLFVPPSYMESSMIRYAFFFNVLIRLEQLGANFGWQASLSDHFLIKMEKQ